MKYIYTFEKLTKSMDMTEKEVSDEIIKLMNGYGISMITFQNKPYTIKSIHDSSWSSKMSIINRLKKRPGWVITEIANFRDEKELFDFIKKYKINIFENIGHENFPAYDYELLDNMYSFFGKMTESYEFQKWILTEFSEELDNMELLGQTFRDDIKEEFDYIFTSKELGLLENNIYGKQKGLKNIVKDPKRFIKLIDDYKKDTGNQIDKNKIKNYLDWLDQNSHHYMLKVGDKVILTDKNIEPNISKQLNLTKDTSIISIIKEITNKDGNTEVIKGKGFILDNVHIFNIESDNNYYWQIKDIEEIIGLPDMEELGLLENNEYEDRAEWEIMELNDMLEDDLFHDYLLQFIEDNTEHHHWETFDYTYYNLEASAYQNDDGEIKEEWELDEDNEDEYTEQVIQEWDMEEVIEWFSYYEQQKTIIDQYLGDGYDSGKIELLNFVRLVGVNEKIKEEYDFIFGSEELGLL